MRKLFLLFAMLISLAVSTQAQTSQVATLSHNGTVTTFYSADAFRDACEAAADGDIITLSPGIFRGENTINKGVTIRGAGMEPENNPTIIDNGVTISNSEASDEYCVTLEGVIVRSYVNIYNANRPTLIKMRAEYLSLNTSTGDAVTNAFCADCIFDDLYITTSSSSINTSSFINCIINQVGNLNPTSAYFGNCVIIPDTGLYNTTFSNCIFLGITDYYSVLQSTCIATYCYYQGGFGDFFFTNLYPSSDTNHVIGSDVVIFKEGTTYELSDNLATTWLGDDGTQVGIYGGLMPFDPIVPIPHITKFNVAPKTTADGKLAVEIEVKSN